MRLAAGLQITPPTLPPDRADANQVLAKVRAWQWDGDPGLSRGGVDLGPSSYSVLNSWAVPITLSAYLLASITRPYESVAPGFQLSPPLYFCS